MATKRGGAGGGVGTVLAVFLYMPLAASAASLSWVGGTDSNFLTASNWSPATVPSSADDVTIDVSTLVFVPAGTTANFNSLTLGDSNGVAVVTLEIAGALSSFGALTINPSATLLQATTQPSNLGSVSVSSGGVISHLVNISSRSYVVNLNVSGDFALFPGALIALDGLGYAGGNGIQVGGFGPGAGAVGQLNGGGGGHGGVGGANDGTGSVAGSAYDSLTNPNDLGSGGGTSAEGVTGGSGGGALILQVGGVLNLNGLISANGALGIGNGVFGGGAGGGAGGAINVSAGSLVGTGTLRVNGGAGSVFGGSGGAGGRIAIRTTSSDSSNLSLLANAGGSIGVNKAVSGGAGVIALNTPGGANYSLAIGTSTLSPEAGTPVAGSSLTFSTVTVSRAIVMFDPNSTVSINALTVVGIATITANNLVFGGNSPIEIMSGGTLVLNANSTTGGNLIVDSGGVFTQANAVALNFTSVVVNAGGVLTHLPGTSLPVAKLNISVSGDLDLHSGAVINVDGLGYAGTTQLSATGTGPGAGIGGQVNGGGGSHGGAGGASDRGGSGSTYDSISNPTDLGSSGGNAAAGFAGNGAGAVILNIGGTFHMNGVLSANGGQGTGNSGVGTGGGGGSGGSIYVTAASLDGSGTARANGGSAAAFLGGAGGGGGRIAFYYGAKTGTRTLQVNGGAGSSAGGGVGGAGSIIDNGQLVGSVQPSTTTSLVPMQQQLTTSQNLTGTLSAQSLNFSGAASTSALVTNFTVAQINLVTLQTGSFAGDGFFNGTWTLPFNASLSLSGTWQGAALLNSSPRQMVLKGVMEGGIRGVLEGVLTESSSGSGVFNVLSLNCTAIEIASQQGSTPLSFSGTAPAPQLVSYPSTPLTLNQASLTGQTNGYYTGALNTTYTLLRVNSAGNPYNGDGFFLPSYTSSLGSGVGWAYASSPGVAAVTVSGLLDQPLRGLFEGALVLGSSPSAFFTLERLDQGLSVQPILRVDSSGPGSAGAGALDSFSINVHNDGFASAPSVSVVAAASEWADFVSASGQYSLYISSNFWNGTLSEPRPFVRWDYTTIPPRSSVKLYYQARIRNPIPGGPAPHQLIDGPRVELVPISQADQIFASFPPGGNQ